MNRLTELERELLASVQALQDGLKQEVAQSRNSLNDYDTVMKSRLSSIETRLNEQDERLNRAFKLLLKTSDALERQLPALEKSLKDLAATVRRYVR